MSLSQVLIEHSQTSGLSPRILLECIQPIMGTFMNALGHIMDILPDLQPITQSEYNEIVDHIPNVSFPPRVSVGRVFTIAGPNGDFIEVTQIPRDSPAYQLDLKDLTYMAELIGLKPDTLAYLPLFQLRAQLYTEYPLYLDWLLDQGLDVNGIYHINFGESEGESEDDEEGGEMTIMTIAAVFENVPLMRKILAKGFDVNRLSELDVDRLISNDLSKELIDAGFDSVFKTFITKTDGDKVSPPEIPSTQTLSAQANYVSNLSPECQSFIRYYTGPGFQLIAYVLRNSVTKAATITAMAQNIFRKVPPTTETVTLYRGVPIPVTENFRDLGIMSTSLNLNVALKFVHENDCCLYVITAPRGSKLLPVSHITRNQGEDEVLLPPGSQLRLVKEEIETHKFHGAQDIKVTVYYCDLVL